MLLTGKASHSPCVGITNITADVCSVSSQSTFFKKNDSVDPVDRKLSWFFVASQEYCRKASKKVPEAPIRIAWEGAALENSWVFDRDGKIGTFSKKTKNPGMC